MELVNDLNLGEIELSSDVCCFGFVSAICDTLDFPPETPRWVPLSPSDK